MTIELRNSLCRRFGFNVMHANTSRSAHLVGACGTGMKALAEVLLDSNWILTGSDLSFPNASMRRLIDRGLGFHQGHSADNVPSSAQCLIYSPAIPVDNVERLEAVRRRFPQYSYSQIVGQLMRQSTGVCIAGTHGKSTTTAMTASILQAAGRLSHVVLGAELCDGGRSGWSGSGDLFVAESCEFQKSFLDFQPKFATILNIEPDHFDCYSDFASLELAFREFADRISDDGVLLVNSDCPASRKTSVTSATRSRRVSFGSNPTADWTAVDRKPTIHGTRFSLMHRGKSFCDIELKLHGQHNVLNALAAAVLCAEIGVSPEIIRESLNNFRGIRRRFEFMAELNEMTFIDDYAHHPTAVKVTLQTLRDLVGSRRILCVFQPHQVSRATALMGDFAASFDNADIVFVAPVYAARETVTNEPQLISQELANRIAFRGVVARAFTSLDQIVNTLEDATVPGDVIVTMGAGDIDRIHHDFTRRIQ